MTTWQLIRAMTQRGYTLEAGPHNNYRGYYAQFRLNELPDRWTLAGHGLTLHRAVVMAAKIALGKPIVIPSDEKFQ